MKWPFGKFEDVALPVKGAIVSGPFGSNIGSRFFVDEGVPIIRGNNLTFGERRFIDDGFAFLTEEKAKEFKNCQAVAGDLVFTAAGTIGQVGIIPEDTRFDRYVISNKQLRVRCDLTKVCPLFLFLWFTTEQMRQHMINQNRGCSIPLINLGTLRKLPVPLPPLSVQVHIAATISAYDELMENNRRRIALLEESARLLYREWFVRLRFPGHQHCSVTDGLPNGWERVAFPDAVDFLEGPGLRNHQYREEGIPFLNIRTIKDDEIDFSKVQYLDDNEVESRYTHFLLAEDDHVVSSSGTLGRVVTIRACHLPVMLNTSLIRMRAKSRIATWFLKSYLKYGDFLDHVTSMATGAAQLNDGPMHLNALKLNVPSFTVLELFEEQASGIFRQIKTLLDINLKLRAARDLLLPRLMSGEVEV